MFKRKDKSQKPPQEALLAHPLKQLILSKLRSNKQVSQPIELMGLRLRVSPLAIIQGFLAPLSDEDCNGLRDVILQLSDEVRALNAYPTVDTTTNRPSGASRDDRIRQDNLSGVPVLIP